VYRNFLSGAVFCSRAPVGRVAVAVFLCDLLSVGCVFVFPSRYLPLDNLNLAISILGNCLSSILFNIPFSDIDDFTIVCIMGLINFHVFFEINEFDTIKCLNSKQELS